MTRFICLICLFPCVLKGPCYRCPVNFVAQELPTDHKIAQIANTFVSAASTEKNGRQNNSFNFLIVTISAISARKILHNCCTKFCSQQAKDGTVVSKQRTPGHVLNWNYSCFEITPDSLSVVDGGGMACGGWTAAAPVVVEIYLYCAVCVVTCKLSKVFCTRHEERREIPLSVLLCLHSNGVVLGVSNKLIYAQRITEWHSNSGCLAHALS